MTWIDDIDEIAWDEGFEDDTIYRCDLQRAVKSLTPALQQAVLDMLRNEPVRDRADEQNRYRARKKLRSLMS